MMETEMARRLVTRWRDMADGLVAADADMMTDGAAAGLRQAAKELEGLCNAADGEGS